MIETSDMQFDSRMVTAEETPEDHDVEVTLRPQTLAEYIGQDKVKEKHGDLYSGSEAAR